MWRRYGEAAYAALVITVFTVEAAALTFLTWAFLFGRFGSDESLGGLRVALTLAVATTAIAVMVVTAYTLVFQAFSEWRSRKHREGVATWTERWVDVAFGAQGPRMARLTPAAVEALVEVKHRLQGAEATVITKQLVKRGVIEDLVAAAEGRTGGRRPGRLARRLEALDLLSRAGVPRGVEALVRLTRDSDLAVRVMALRAVAHATSGLTGDDARRRAGTMLVDAFARADVPAGAIEEAVLLVGGAAPTTLRTMLARTDRPDLVRIALDAVGRLRIAELVDDVAVLTDHDDPDVRCAAWRAFAGVGALPELAAALLPRAAHDAEPKVRSQVARACRLLPREEAIPGLRPLLADPSWWVRRAAGWALMGAGDAGVAALQYQAHAHDDRYATHTAIQVLVDGGRIDASTAVALQAAS